MPTIVYIHGFLSSPLSFKAQVTKGWLEKSRPDIEFLCPELSANPEAAVETLLKAIDNRAAEELYLIGSSLGGFWATYLIDSGMASKAVLINPAVAPQERLHEYVNCKLENFYSQDTYILTEEDFQAFTLYDVGKVSALERYWLMLQKGDEVLDYRRALSHYAGCKFLLEEGGNHSFEGYERWLPAIIDYFSL